MERNGAGGQGSDFDKLGHCAAKSGPRLTSVLPNKTNLSIIVTRGSIETGPKALLSSDAAGIAGFDTF